MGLGKERHRPSRYKKSSRGKDSMIGQSNQVRIFQIDVTANKKASLGDMRSRKQRQIPLHSRISSFGRLGLMVLKRTRVDDWQQIY